MNYYAQDSATTSQKMPYLEYHGIDMVVYIKSCDNLLNLLEKAGTHFLSAQSQSYVPNRNMMTSFNSSRSKFQRPFCQVMMESSAL